MTPSDSASPTAFPRARLVGVDAARGVALFGMMVTHLIPLVSEGDTSWAIIFAGRASALFAVLAGIGIALSISPSATRGSRGWLRVGAGLATRAGIIIAIGLTLAAFDTGLAVILVHYGLLFILAIPFLRLPAVPLAFIGSVWMIGMPLVVHGWRRLADFPPFDYGNPEWTELLDPGPLLAATMVTGYYPVLLWFGYLLIGMALGRIRLDDPWICLALAIIGSGVAIAAKASSEALLATRGWERIAAEHPTSTDLSPFTLDYIARVSGFGIVPEGTWWWQAVSGPHTGTPFDLVHTTGSALVVIGVLGCLASAGRFGTAILAPLAWPGSMPLTVYTCHVLAMIFRDRGDPGVLLIVQILAAIVLAGVWRLLAPRFGWRRGPLEELTARGSRRVRELIPTSGGDGSPD